MGIDLSKTFKIDFNISDYLDIVPPIPDNDRAIINIDEWEAGEYHKCVWKKVLPEKITPEYIQQEAGRLKAGVWICIKDMPIYLPPSYYFFLQYWNTGGKNPEFRLKMLKYVYHKLRCRKNPRCIGSVCIKNRQDGMTTIEMSDCLFECMIGNMDYAQIGIQSKTLETVVRSCWRTLRMGWQKLPEWVKDTFYPDFVSGDKIARTFKFIKEADGSQEGRDVLIAYGAATHNAFDSLNNMRLCVLDEFAKYLECDFYATFLNYKNFILPGAERKGLFCIISSPSDTDGKHNDQAKEFWQQSEYLVDEGTSKSGVFRHYSNPLEGIDGFYDEFGDADPEVLKAHIMKKRKDVPKQFLQSEIRACPLNEFEMFGATDTDMTQWDNQKGIEERKVFLLGRRFKDNITKEPVKVYGNLEWYDGIVDSHVVFRQYDTDEFDVHNARFCFSTLPSHQEPLRYSSVTVRGIGIGQRPRPPEFDSDVIGVDPFEKRYPGKNPSNGAMVNIRYRDLYETGIVKCPTMIYCCRPQHAEIFFEDCIKAAVFNQAYIQPESINSKLIDFCEDRGYMDWLLSKIGQPKNSLIKGDAPSGGKNELMNEIIGLINANTNLPLTPQDPYLLERHWFYELLEDISKFDRVDTHANDLSMALGQGLLGMKKLLYKKGKKKSALSNVMFEHLLG